MNNKDVEISNLKEQLRLCESVLEKYTKEETWLCDGPLKVRIKEEDIWRKDTYTPYRGGLSAIRYFREKRAK